MLLQMLTTAGVGKDRYDQFFVGANRTLNIAI
jgi:hypothetical protein